MYTWQSQIMIDYLIVCVGTADEYSAHNRLLPLRKAWSLWYSEHQYDSITCCFKSVMKNKYPLINVQVSISKKRKGTLIKVWAIDYKILGLIYEKKRRNGYFS